MQSPKTLSPFPLILLFIGICATVAPPKAAAQEQRFKADLLVVVAHPDDETPIASYLARIALDQHKRIAVVFGTGGGSGGDAQGQQQSRALAEIRELEARRALAHFGIGNVFFLRGLDTPGQDVLRSLENWNHGDQLDRLVRIVRLTQPDIIVTWLPAVLIGEDHGDHQAAAVLATEAFDLAGDPTAFPEQVAAPRDARGNDNLLEGLAPWQPQKLYFYSDTTHPKTLEGTGPAYPPTGTSPSRGVSYVRLAAEESAEHLTQGDSGVFAQRSLTTGDYGYLADTVQFVLGKAYTEGTTVTSDVFAGLEPAGIPFRSAPGYHGPALPPAPLQLAGPWLFYKQFWRAHGLTPLAPSQPEISINTESPATIPVLLDNPSDRRVTRAISVQLPQGWIYWRQPPSQVTIAPHASTVFTFTARSPAGEHPPSEFVIKADDLTPLRLRVVVSRAAMPQ